MAWLVVVAVLLDAASMILGLSLGLPEAGPAASRLMPVLGPVYFGLELALLLGLYRVLAWAGVPGHWAALAAAVGPWTAGWHNTGLLLRLGVLGGAV